LRHNLGEGQQRLSARIAREAVVPNKTSEERGKGKDGIASTDPI
jgi:hypothetical protein